jgi:hypothetical protein
MRARWCPVAASSALLTLEVAHGAMGRELRSKRSPIVDVACISLKVGRVWARKLAGR